MIMKKKWTKIIICIASLILLLFFIMYVCNIHISPDLSIKLSPHDYGEIESYIKIQDNNNLHYVGKTKTKMININFDKVMGVFWSKTLIRIYNVSDVFDSQVNLQYYSSNREDEYLLFGLCNNTEIVRIELNRQNNFEKDIYPNDSGLFAIKVKKGIDTIEGFDSEGILIYQRNISGLMP